MTPSVFAALCLFAFATSITPGPNNTMMLASGVRFGFRRSLGHLAGIGFGFGFMMLMVGLGLHAVLQAYPVILVALRYVGGAYMLWLAFRLATAPVPKPTSMGDTAKPMGFWAAAAFQWVNPKAWIMAMTAMSTYVLPDASMWQVALVAIIFTLINIPCISTWLAFGSAMRGLLQKPVPFRIFSVTMALALAASLIPMLAS